MKQEFLTDVQFGRLVARAWQDDDFRRKLEADPTATIQAFAREVLGIEVEYPIYMPPRPADLSDEQLAAAKDGAPLESAPKTFCEVF